MKLLSRLRRMFWSGSDPQGERLHRETEALRDRSSAAVQRANRALAERMRLDEEMRKADVALFRHRSEHS